MSRMTRHVVKADVLRRADPSSVAVPRGLDCDAEGVWGDVVVAADVHGVARGVVSAHAGVEITRQLTRWGKSETVFVIVPRVVVIVVVIVRQLVVAVGLKQKYLIAVISNDQNANETQR